MGMFSTVYNHCPLLGEDFLGELQTKDLESLMDCYWLSPVGELFLIDWADSFQMKPIEERPTKRTKWGRLFLPEWEKTGKKGKLKPYNRSFVARFYPARTTTEWKEVYAFFKMGRFNALLPRDEVYFLST